MLTGADNFEMCNFCASTDKMVILLEVVKSTQERYFWSCVQPFAARPLKCLALACPPMAEQLPCCFSLPERWSVLRSSKTHQTRKSMNNLSDSCFSWSTKTRQGYECLAKKCSARLYLVSHRSRALFSFKKFYPKFTVSLRRSFLKEYKQETCTHSGRNKNTCLWKEHL